MSCCICWPLQYLPLVHSVKHHVIICAWIITKLKDICLLLIEGIKERLEDIFKTEPPWPTVVGATFARTAGIVLIVVIVVLIIFIVISYCLFCREGRHAGRLNSSNKKARKTITIHGLQMSLHLLLRLVDVGRRLEDTLITLFYIYQPFLFCCLHYALTLCFMGSKTKSCKPSYSTDKDLVHLLTTWQTVMT